jgi:cytochrome c-type protein NapB
MNVDETTNRRGRFTTVFLFALIAFAMIGYVVGISDGVPKPDGVAVLLPDGLPLSKPIQRNDKVIDAINYSEIPKTAMGPTAAFEAKLASLPKQPAYDLFKKIIPSAAEKAESDKIRASRRAFNGAPPIIPHTVENTNDSACYACHSNGAKMAGMKASVMSHEYLANCTQCHAPPPPVPFKDADWSVQSDFVGLPAPKAGERAFTGAPPTIPHSQWMREKCNACHGGPNGWAGMESTHPWRTNCTQCHAPSAVLDQAIPTETIPMLPPIKVAGN